MLPSSYCRRKPSTSTFVGEQIDEQNVADVQFGFGGRLHQRTAALDGDEIGPRLIAQAKFGERLTDQRRACVHAHAVFAAGQFVLVDPVGQLRPATAAVGRVVVAAEPAPGKEHVERCPAPEPARQTA